MIQKIIKKSARSNQKSMEIEAWTGLEVSWRSLGSHLGSRGGLAQKKKTDDHKMTASRLPFGGPFSSFSLIFQICFAFLF